MKMEKIKQVKEGKDMKEENEKKKEYLLSYKKYKQEAKRLGEQLEELRTGEQYPCLVLSDMPKAHNKKDLSDYMVRREELIDKIIKARKNAVEKFSEVQNRIEQMEDEIEKTLLTQRYLRNYNWEKICEEIQYSYKQVHRIHLKALQNFRLNE